MSRTISLAVVCLTLSLSQSPILVASDLLSSAENAQFEIVGLDQRSVSYVDRLSQHIVKIAGRYLDVSGLEFPQRILIRLMPVQYVDFSGDYQIRVEERGFVSLDMRWRPETTLRVVSRAIGEALLVRYSIYNHGSDRIQFLPDWIGVGIGTQAYLSLRSAEIGELHTWVDLSATPTLRSVIERKWNDEVADTNGFCLLFALERSDLERRDIRSLIARSIAGHDIICALEQRIQSDHPEGKVLSVDEWWTRETDRLISESTELFESMEESRVWIAQLSDVSEMEKGVNLRSLWEQRNDEDLRKSIEARYQILRIRLARVNPSYFNSAQALGSVFELFLYGDRSREYIHSLAVFFGEFEDMKRLERQVAQSL